MTEQHPDWPYALLGSNGISVVEVRTPVEADVVELAARMITAQVADTVVETVPPHLKAQIEELVQAKPRPVEL